MSLQMSIDELHDFLQRDFPQVENDFTIMQLDADELHVRLNVQEKHLRPGGTVSGPTMFGLVDVSVYIAILARLGPVALAVTTNCSIDFMRKPARDQELISKTRILKMGRSLVVGDVLVFSGDDPRPVARANLTYSIPPAQQMGG